MSLWSTRTTFSWFDNVALCGFWSLGDCVVVKIAIRRYLSSCCCMYVSCYCVFWLQRYTPWAKALFPRSLSGWRFDGKPLYNNSHFHEQYLITFVSFQQQRPSLWYTAAFVVHCAYNAGEQQAQLPLGHYRYTRQRQIFNWCLTLSGNCITGQGCICHTVKDASRCELFQAQLWKRSGEFRHRILVRTTTRKS